MQMRIAALVALNLLAAFVVASAGGQAQWDERAVHGGVELWLLNDEGTAIVLRCAGQAVHAAFVFTEPIEAARGALVIGVLLRIDGLTRRTRADPAPARPARGPRESAAASGRCRRGSCTPSAPAPA